MTTGSKPVYALPLAAGEAIAQPGLSLREYYAGMCLMKLIDRSKIQIGDRDVSHVDAAVILADELIDALNRINDQGENK